MELRKKSLELEMQKNWDQSDTMKMGTINN